MGNPNLPDPDTLDEPAIAVSLFADGQQIAALFRNLKLSSAQAVKYGVVWYFEGGITVRQNDGVAGFLVSLTPERTEARDGGPLGF